MPPIPFLIYESNKAHVMKVEEASLHSAPEYDPAAHTKKGHLLIPWVWEGHCKAGQWKEAERTTCSGQRQHQDQSPASHRVYWVDPGSLL